MMAEHPVHQQRFRPGAEAGDPAAMAGLGWALLQQGRDADAELWYARAADSGELSAMTGLGFLLDRRGAKEDAWVWWRQAAAAGDAHAMNYLSGSLRRRHPEEAERWGWHASAARRGARTDEVPAEVASAAVALGTHRCTFGFDPAKSDVGFGDSP